ncbi:MAG: hypothetical protein WBW33_15415 [Bryobacteraceae bacterium]
MTLTLPGPAPGVLNEANVADDELDLLTHALVEETDEVISNLGLDVRKAQTPPYGSERYMQVFFAYDRLLQAQRAFTRPTIAVWRTVAEDGHSGDVLVQKVWELLKELECLGEGPKTQC